MTQHIWKTPLVCSQGGIPYNNDHIEYWKKQAKISYEMALHLRTKDRPNT